jgi:hypothetical protein
MSILKPTRDTSNPRPGKLRPDRVQLSAASDIGTEVEGRGIYHGAWQPRANGVIVHAYCDSDFLRDTSREQMLLNWYGARYELARRNNFRSYGDGTEPALRQALAKPSGTKGAYQDGDLVMGPRVLLTGVDEDGEKVLLRAGRNTFDLLSGSKDNAFKNILETLRDARSDGGRWSWLCTEAGGDSTYMRAVNLLDAIDGRDTKDGHRYLGVLQWRAE